MTEEFYKRYQKLIVHEYNSYQINNSNIKLSDESNECLEKYHLFIISILTGVLIKQAWINTKGEQNTELDLKHLFRLVLNDCVKIVTKYVSTHHITTEGNTPPLSSIKTEHDILSQIIGLSHTYTSDFKESVLYNKAYVLFDYDEKSDTFFVSKEYGRKHFHHFLMDLVAINVNEVEEGRIIITNCEDYEVNWEPVEEFFNELMLLYKDCYSKFKNL